MHKYIDVYIVYVESEKQTDFISLLVAFLSWNFALPIMRLFSAKNDLASRPAELCNAWTLLDGSIDYRVEVRECAWLFHSAKEKHFKESEILFRFKSPFRTRLAWGQGGCWCLFSPCFLLLCLFLPALLFFGNTIDFLLVRLHVHRPGWTYQAWID